jgi:hypothetical protein
MNVFRWGPSLASWVLSFFPQIILSNLNGFIFSKAEVQWFICALISYSPCSSSGFSRYIVFAMHLYNV